MFLGLFESELQNIFDFEAQPDNEPGQAVVELRHAPRWQLPADRQVGEAVCTLARLNQEKAWTGAEDAERKNACRRLR